MASDTLKDIFFGRLSCTDSERQLEGEGSQDLFDSQTSSQLHSGIDITLQLTEYGWVQCDNADCQKWRKVPTNMAENLQDTPWYCSMNPDPRADSCGAPEEDHTQYDRMAKQAGIKFVMSMLQAGSLIWAKMAGYCSWPAMVTVDPDMGVFVWLDMEGDPCSYHVEFLGIPHTHSWVAAKQIEVYGHKKLQDGLDGDSQKSSSKGKCGIRKSRKRVHTSQPKLRLKFRSSHINTVIEEADCLMKLTPKQRLQYSIFKPKAKIVQENVLKENQNQNGSCKTCGQNKKGRACKTGRVRTKSSVKMGTNRQTNRSEKKPLCREESDSLSVDEGISVPTFKSDPGSSVYGFESPDQLSQSKLKFQNTLTDKTKEEKFAIDINMYRKNEQAFEHDVRRFMSRNGLKIRSTPVWNNIPVKLFQMFLAVYERGGYYTVTEKKKWTAVYRELTEHHVSSGNVAKNYYEKNLLPYELYIKGKDYVPVLTQRSRNKKPNLSATTHSRPVDQQKKENVPKPVQNLDSKMFDDSQTNSSCQDIGKLLGKLEEDYQAVIFKPDATEGLKEAIGLKFHDDTTESSDLKYENAAAEFQNHNQQAERSGCVEMHVEEVEDKILHEMKALQDDLNKMNEGLQCLIDKDTDRL